jgi:hypothetical protein
MTVRRFVRAARDAAIPGTKRPFGRSVPSTPYAVSSIPRQMFTAYYILAVSFGVCATLISLYAILVRKDHGDFPGKLYVPIMLIGAVFAVATLTAVIHGGNEEVKHRKEEKAAKAAEKAAGAQLPVAPLSALATRSA